MNSIVHLLSGGLDSTVLLYEWRQNRPRESILCLIADYGQTHVKEIEFAIEHCKQLAVAYRVANLRGLFGNSSLVDGGEDIIVPNRNMVLLSVAIATAASKGFGAVSYAANRDDWERFPDCSPDFVRTLEIAANVGGAAVQVWAPYLHLPKKEIVQRGRAHGVDFAKTWSCYAGGAAPCEKCLACEKRAEALS
jgi:7-cyano-7-deazaguanine synthase